MGYTLYILYAFVCFNEGCYDVAPINKGYVNEYTCNIQGKMSIEKFLRQPEMNNIYISDYKITCLKIIKSSKS